MRIRVRLFSLFRDAAGGIGELEVELEDGSKLSELIEVLSRELPRLAEALRAHPSLVLINGEAARGDPTLREEDEVALAPIPSGG
ncbi:MAG: MoaD/ThiS family protein [Fervidicoccaceae archaeon]